MITSARRPFLLALALSAVLATPGAAWSASATPVAPGGPDQARLDARMGPLEMASVRRDGGQLAGNAAQASISADGRYVTYTSRNTEVAGVPRNRRYQVLRFDRRTRTTELVSATKDGSPGGGHSEHATMSADGRIVVFETEASDLMAEPRVRTKTIVARDMQTGETTLVSQTPSGDAPRGGSYNALVSADGSLVSFLATSTDVVGSAGSVVFDRDTGVSTAVHIDTAGGTFRVTDAELSGDGEWLTFSSGDAEIVPGDDNGAWDAFLLHRASGEVTLVSRSADGTVANGYSGFRAVVDGDLSPKPDVSADGSTVAFMSKATDLAGAEEAGGDGELHVYAYDVASGTSELVTALPDGSPAHEGYIHDSTISPDGRYVAVSTTHSLDGRLDPSRYRVFLRDLVRDTTRAVSGEGAGIGAGIGGSQPHVAFISRERLLPEDDDNTYDVYWRRVW